MRAIIIGLALVGLAATASCSSDSGGDTAGGASGGSGATGGSGGTKDSAPDSPGDAKPDTQGPSCTNGVKDGSETDVDCGGPCPACADGKACGKAGDCKSAVCQSTCQGASCSDGVKNGDETGVDCGGSCPAKYHGEGCVTGTAGSQVCSSFPNDGGAPSVNDAGVEMFDVALSWNAAGGNAYVDYAVIYAPGGGVFNSQGIAGGSPNNICTSGPVTEKLQLPLGDQYTYKIWHAYCVKTNACSGCGSDVVVAEGGPFGIAKDKCQ